MKWMNSWSFILDHEHVQYVPCSVIYYIIMVGGGIHASYRCLLYIIIGVVKKLNIYNYEERSEETKGN